MLAAHVALAGLTAAVPAEQLPAPSFGQADVQVAVQAPQIPGSPALPAQYELAQAEEPLLTDPALEPTAELPAPAAKAATATEPPVESAPATTEPPRDLAALKGYSDPLEFLNRIFYAVTQPIDRFLIRPAAMIYQAVIPRPARDGVRNAISNLFEPVVFVNDLLQLRPERAIRTLGRFLINTLIGAGGLFDIAKRKPFKIPYHPNNFGNTLGYYGVGPLVYMYLPVLGPTTLRDTVGQQGDGQYHSRLVDVVLRPNRVRNEVATGQADTSQFGTIITIVDGLDKRAENDAELKALTADSVDPYAALRSSFLQGRAGEIASLKAKGDGNAAPPIEFDDPLDDPAGTEASSAAEPALPKVALPLAK